MTKKITFAIVSILLLSFTAVSDFRTLVQEKLDNYIKSYPEKIYVQTDKPYYALGEDIWYSAYLVNGINHKASNKSKVLYVELVNEEDSIVSKKQLYTFNVNTAGDFKIEKNWKPGNYILRAYTNYMRNNSSDYFFKKQIPIWDVSKTNISNNETALTETQETETNTPKTVELREKPNIQFYPEGGYLIDGLASKVGIKANDKLKRNIILDGVIKDSNNNTISVFKTAKYGLGVITLIPEAGKKYHASVMINGVEYMYPLPETLPNGYNLSVVNNGSHLIINAKSNATLGLTNSFLLAHQRGAIIFEKLETENTNSYTLKLDTKTLNDGVTHFTLFNNEGKPVCERLVYINNPNNDIQVNLVAQNTSPKTREKVNYNIDLKDKQGNSIGGNLSMSITDIDAVGQSSKYGNIKTYLLLNSDLRGHIDNPGYFFEKENDPRRRYLLDLVMLTHGWRRFTWNKFLFENTNTKTVFNPEIGLFISGRTTTKRKNTPIPASTRLTFMGAFPYQEKKPSDSSGVFKYGPFVFMDTVATLLEARVKEFQKQDEETNKNRKVEILLDNNSITSPKISHNAVLGLNLEDETKIINFKKQSQNIYNLNEDFLRDARLLDEIVITATKKSEEEKRRELMNEKAFYGHATNRIDMKEYENMENLSIIDLINLLPGVNVANDSISIRGAGTPSIYLNNFPVEYTDISTMTGADVDFIDVLKGADAAFFPNSSNGVIVIHQKEGVDVLARNVIRKPGIIDFKAVGFYTAREFYAPNHLDDFETSTKKDIRTTLHWEPSIILNNENEKANISFFTSDIRSNYAIKIEGITNTGIPVYHLSTFEVE